MTLSALKQYIQSKPQVTLTELSSEFQEPAETIQCMLQHFIHKGYLKECRMTPKCGSVCQQCQFATMVIYRWQNT